MNLSHHNNGDDDAHAITLALNQKLRIGLGRPFNTLFRARISGGCSSFNVYNEIYWSSGLSCLFSDHATRASTLVLIQQNKNKADIPTVAAIENIFLEFDISPAKYHGGKLNGIDCRESMVKAKSLFHNIKPLLLSISHPNRCSDETIIQHCDIFQDILVTLDLICSKIRIKRGEIKDSDILEVKRASRSLDYLWNSAGLSFTPKIHGVLSHAAEQVERLNGIGDLLEDDLEHLHQMSKKLVIKQIDLKTRTSRQDLTLKWRLS